MKLVLGLTLGLTASLTLASPIPRITSAYTKIDLERCKEVEHEDEGGYTLWRCPGFQKTPLYVEVGDERFDVDAGVPDQDVIDSATFDEVPSIVEWRLENGVPFAIIYRLTVANPDVPRTSRLLVESIGKGKWIGCRVASILGSPNANEEARRIADKIRLNTATCLPGIYDD